MLHLLRAATERREGHHRLREYGMLLMSSATSAARIPTLSFTRVELRGRETIMERSEYTRGTAVLHSEPLDVLMYSSEWSSPSSTRRAPFLRLGAITMKERF